MTNTTKEFNLNQRNFDEQNGRVRKRNRRSYQILRKLIIVEGFIPSFFFVRRNYTCYNERNKPE